MKNNNCPILLMTIAVLYGCSGGGNEGSETKTPERIIPVEVQVIAPDTFQRILSFTGTILPWQETKLGAQSPGRVEKIYVEEGSRVSAGDLLVQMDDAQLKQARIQYQVAEDNFRRMDTLFKVGSVAQQQLDNVRAQYESARTAYELVLKNTQLRALFSGMITGKYMNEGEVFTMAPNPLAGGTAAIVALQQINPVKALISVSEKDFPVFRTGMKAKVTADVITGKIFEGEVSKAFPTINSLSRTFYAELKIPNAQELLRPGMFARVTVEAGEVIALTVPKYALLTQPGTSIRYCFSVADSIAVRNEITTGQGLEENIEIITGLSAGERLVVNGQGALKDGAKVMVK